MKIYSDQFNILEFYGYPSYQQNIINEWDDFWKRGDKSVKRFFEEILNRAEKKFGKKIMDNKIVFKLRLENSDSIIYAGYKDGIYKISLSAKSESLLKLTYET